MGFLRRKNPLCEKGENVAQKPPMWEAIFSCFKTPLGERPFLVVVLIWKNASHHGVLILGFPREKIVQINKKNQKPPR